MLYNGWLRSLVAGVGLLVLLPANELPAVVIYQEDFTGQDGKGATGATGLDPTIDVSGVFWDVDVSGASLVADDDYFRVVSGAFVGRDIGGSASWMSPTIGISGFTNVGFSLDAEELGTHESSDYFDVFFAIDGGQSTLIANFAGNGEAGHTLIDDWTPQRITHSGLSGNSLRLTVEMRNNAADERMILDNIVVTGTPISPDQVPEPAGLLVWSVMIAWSCLVAAWYRRRAGTAPELALSRVPAEPDLGQVRQVRRVEN